MLKGDLVFQFVENHYRNFIEKFSFPLDIEYGSAMLSIESAEVSYSRGNNQSRICILCICFAGVFSSGDNKEL